MPGRPSLSSLATLTLAASVLGAGVLGDSAVPARARTPIALNECANRSAIAHLWAGEQPILDR